MNVRELKEYLTSIPNQDRVISFYFLDNGDRYYPELNEIDLDIDGHLEFNVDITTYN